MKNRLIVLDCNSIETEMGCETPVPPGNRQMINDWFRKSTGHEFEPTDTDTKVAEDVPKLLPQIVRFAPPWVERSLHAKAVVEGAV